MFPSKQFCISHTPVKPVTITHSLHRLFSLSLGASLQFLFQPHSPSAVDPASQQSSVRSSSGQAQNPKAHQVTTGSTHLNPGQILKEKELRENRGKRNLKPALKMGKPPTSWVDEDALSTVALQHWGEGNSPCRAFAPLHRLCYVMAQTMPRAEFRAVSLL